MNWQFGSRNYSATDWPLIMGILNVTPDSFSDGGHFATVTSALEHGRQLVQDGAGIIDIGGESSRPGAKPVSAQAEIERVVPVIAQLSKQIAVPISIDTCKTAVAEAALKAGAEIVNDITGFQDPGLVAVCKQHQAGLICMHMQGTPQTMQQNPSYENVVAEIGRYLQQQLHHLQALGIAPGSVVLDPGIGFGKTAEHNLEILANIEALHALGRPILIGHSRKRFLAKVIERDIDERLFGTVGISIALSAQSVEILRVHDVRATRDALLAYQAVMRYPK